MKLNLLKKSFLKINFIVICVKTVVLEKLLVISSDVYCLNKVLNDIYKKNRKNN